MSQISREFTDRQLKDWFGPACIAAISRCETAAEVYEAERVIRGMFRALERALWKGDLTHWNGERYVRQQGSGEIEG